MRRFYSINRIVGAVEVFNSVYGNFSSENLDGMFKEGPFAWTSYLKSPIYRLLISLTALSAKECKINREETPTSNYFLLQQNVACLLKEVYLLTQRFVLDHLWELIKDSWDCIHSLSISCYKKVYLCDTCKR
jgi:hypothetical protein